MITPEEERRYGLKPLPEAPFCGAEEAVRLNRIYEASRAGRNPPFRRGPDKDPTPANEETP